MRTLMTCTRIRNRLAIRSKEVRYRRAVLKLSSERLILPVVQFGPSIVQEKFSGKIPSTSAGYQQPSRKRVVLYEHARSLR